MRWFVTLSMVLALTVFIQIPALGHPKHWDPPDEYTFDPADQVVKSQLLDNPEYYDAGIAITPQGRWLTWLEFVPGQGDYLWFGKRSQHGWDFKTRLTRQAGVRLKNPTLTVDGTGTLWLSYEMESDEQWDIFARRWTSQKEFSPACKITPEPGQDIQHAAAPDPDGGIHVVWQQEHEGQFDIATCHVTVKSSSAPFLVSSDSKYGDWDPDIAVTAEGARCIAWDAYDGDRHNVYARVWRDGNWSAVIPIAQSSAFEGKSSLAADHQGRFWILWEEGGRNWGKTFNSGHLPMTESRGALHRFRMLRLAVLDKANKVQQVEPQPPMPMFRRAVGRKNVPPGSERTGCYYERGRLLVDNKGRLWMVYRHFYAPKFLGQRRFSEDNMGPMYAVFARYLDGEIWSDLFMLDLKQGDGDQRLELAPSHDGVAVAWTVGLTRRNYRPLFQLGENRDITEYVPRGLALARLSTDSPPAKPVPAMTVAKPLKSTLADAPPPPSPPSTMVGKTQYRLVYGDLHRHTDLSQCYHMSDGSLTDAYRYAMGPARLDFLGITDHACDLNWANVFGQVWWRSCKEVSRHLLAPRFISFYSFEHSRNFGGMGLQETDHNVISLRPDMLRPEYIPYPELVKQLGNDAFLIPHAPINGNKNKFTIWDFHPPSHQRPLLEIFQGFRAGWTGRSEQEARKGLDDGHRIGFIASSDHQSTAASYACVWTKDLTRESIFRAMQARRTFGATAPIQLAVRAGERWMGEEFTVAKFPEVTIIAKGTAPVRQVDVFLDGELIETLPQQKKKEIELTWAPKSAITGFHYLYFRLAQSDGNRAWSSPMFIHVSD